MTVLIRTHQVQVNAPLQTVFDYVSDLTRHPEWSGGELKIEAVTPGPIAVGKEYRSRGEVAIQRTDQIPFASLPMNRCTSLGLLQMTLISEMFPMCFHLKSKMEVFKSSAP